MYYTEAQRREAAEWFVAIHDEGDPNAETLQAWLRWLERDEGNRLAFESVARAWHATPASIALEMPDALALQADTYAGHESVAEWLAKPPVAADVAAANALPTARFRISIRGLTRLAAGLLIAALLTIMVMNQYFDRRRPQTDEFLTKTAEKMEITLADGSRVWLGPRSRLTVGFTRERRDLQLATGEAYFSVTKDRDRPFTVRSVSGVITAVGTEFNVRALGDHVTVAVSEGVVTIAPKPDQLSAKQAAVVRVASGQQLTFKAEEPTAELRISQSPAVGERARWRDGVLVYRDEPLRDVVMDVARYSNKQLEISGDSIGNLHYSGIVYQGAVDEWASALSESFPVKIVTDGSREIIEAR